MDYGYDVERFNADHYYGKEGCSLSRLAGSDMVECLPCRARVRHGVPEILRCI